MTEKIFKYKADGRDYDVPESSVSDFLKVYPNATIRASVDDRNYDVPPAQMDAFLKVYPTASYTLDGPVSAISDTDYEPTLPEAEEGAPEMSRKERRQARREARRNDDRPSWGESAAKGVGAGFTRTGKGLLDALHQLSAGMLYNDPETGEAKRLESYDAQMQDETNTFRNASVLASETAEELSREADPTGGEKGFVDLIAEGKIGMALQKGLATGAESLPMTLSAYNPWTMALNAISMAGANYAEETLDNPEVDAWKRATKAIGSAAIEQAVEKFADPVFKYIGGGKGAGELTEELAKELVERGTKEATENIAKRIFRVLKNTVKDAAGEGVEEVVTSFGNDALGQALDWIDGDKDYGIRAQWEQMKSENPDADAWDFALAKGKEYMDSFIGGALSGGYMSGTANVFSEGAKFKYDRDARKILDESHAIGSSLDYGDMYDSDDTVREQIDAVAATFTNENGEASISGEFIGTLSSEDAFALSRRNDFTPEHRNALFGLARAKAIQEGLTTKLDERLESQVTANRVLIEAATENGSVITAKHGGRPVYVMGAQNKGDGTVTAPGGQNGPVIVVDALTGEKSYVRSEDVQFAESKNPDECAREVEKKLRQNDARNREAARNTMSVRAKVKAVKPFAGKKILVDVGYGLTEVFVQQISPKGEVTIKGKKGDLGGQSVLILNPNTFYDSIYRDEDGNPVITEAPQETEAETPQEEAPVAETTGDEDYRGQTISILLNGVPTEVEVMSQDNPSNSIVYEYTDASGNRRTASSTIGAFNAAIQQAAEYVAPTETPAEETLPVETVPADSETQAPQEVPVTPENIDWDTLFEQDPEAYFAELQNQYGEEALDILNEEIVAAQEELDSLNKKRGKTQNERLENRKKKVTLQNRIDTLKGMVARLTAPAVETPAVPEATEVPATEVPADVAPVTEPVPTEVTPPVSETPAEPVEETPAVPESTEPAPVEQTPAVEPQPTAQPEAVPTEAEPEPTEQPAEETPTEAEPEPTPTPAPAPTPSKPTTQGGAIARMIGEAKKQIAKLAAKANIKDFTVDDNVRPVFGGVFRKGGYEYASDSQILAKIKAQYPSEQEEKIYSVKTGQEIKGRFPNADWVISSVERVNTEIEANVDDILAAAQAAEELKKGLDKYKKIYVKVGRSIFDSSYLLKAARMAKQQGLTKVTQHPTEHRAMLFAGENGVVLIMPMNGSAIPNKDIIDAKTGEATFGGFTTVSVKTPSSLKGIETARNTLEAIIPNSTEDEIENLKNSNTIELVDGKVVYRFNTADIVSAKNKAKDPNTYAALEAIEKNGLEIPLSSSEIAKLFPESVAPAVPSTAEGTPIAPNPVANPAREAQKREKALAQQLQRYGISPEQKQDMAFNAGKAVGDFFATREEYDAYAENATDLGDYNADFERGVEASFANRQQNVSNPPVNSVPLENEPNAENNGEAATEESGTGQSDSGSVRQTSDRGGQEANQGASDAEPSQGKNKSGSKTKQVASKYPVRNGNATQKLLKDTFGFESVTIPNSRKDTLNAIYDFMMEMSKMLGISPKSIGQGGMLGVGSLNARARATAEHSLRRNKFSLDFINASINFKYAKLEGIAHEWWHALDYALGYFDSSKVYGTTTEMSDRQFSGRKETYDAVQAVMQAIKDSGYPARIRSLTNSRAALKYYLDPTEMAARAFDGYLRDMFAAAGISIEGASYDYIDTDPSQQTSEEMKVIAPAFDNLFKVLQEKEGKAPGTSVLYHIGEMMEEDSPAKRLATEAVLTALDDTGIDVVRATDEQTQQMLDVAAEVAEMQKGTAPETALPEDESSFKGTAISSADGAKIINNLDNLITEYSQKPKNNVKTFIGDVARALEIDKRDLPESSQKSRYATFEAKNGKIFTLRIANHNATVSFFDGNNESEGISVVVSRLPNEGVTNDGDAHIIEFFYKESDIVKSDGQPLVEILKSIKQSLYSGEYKDSTGLTQPQEVNAPELMTVYHGSPSLFEEFDHSHMGEGEGAQAHGWGTYVAVAKKTGEAYASAFGGSRVLHNGEDYTDVAGISDPYSPAVYIVSLLKSYGDVGIVRAHMEQDLDAKNRDIDYFKESEYDIDTYEHTLRDREKIEKALELLDWGEWTVEKGTAILYNVEIPDYNGENYFDASNPTRIQVEKLYDACQKEGLEYAEVIAGETLLDNRPVGDKIVRNLSKMLGSPRAASEFLSRAGFVGIKYDGRRDGECFVIFNESDAKITGRTEFYQTPNGTVYGWTDGKKIYLTNAGINPNTPIHEYTHLWAKAMMQKNPKGWNSIKQLLKGTPVWNEVMNDPNYSSIHNDEDAVASEALSRISGTENAAKMEQMAQQMIDEAKGTARKLEARGLIQNMRDALNKFWKWVGTNLFGIEKFKSVEQITDRVLFDLLNNTDLGTLSEGQVETQIVTDPKVIAELEAGPKRTGYRNVVMNEDGTFSSPMAYWLQGTKTRGGAKSRVETAKFVLGKWEEAEEHPELVDENGHVVLVKPNKDTVEVAYDPYIHNRLDPVNLQFKAAWNRPELVYVETEVPETDLESGYHADQALLPVGVHSWSNGDVMLSKYDKPVRIMPWDAVADAWVERLNGNGVHFDVVPPALRSFLVERGVEILPPHKGMGKDCNDAYEAWKKENEIALSRKGKINANFVEQFEFKQNNERQELEYSDEFRRLQEESARMHERDVAEYHRGKRRDSGSVRQRLGGAFRRELARRNIGGGNKILSHVNKSKGTSFDIIENVDGRLFHDIFAIVRNYLPNGELVDLHDNYNDAICYITTDGLAGFAVDKDGNLISVYSYYMQSKPGFLGAIKDLITEAGATHLDGYNSRLQPLAEIYSKVFGWKVASMMDYNMEYDHDNIAENHGMPQVAFMVNTDANIETRHFDKDQYDDAVAYQLEQVAKSKENSLSSQSYEGTGDAYTDNDGRGMPQEGTGVSGEVPVSGPLSEGRRLARPENGKVSQNGVAGFNPISKREGESDGHRNNREAKFLSVVNNLTSDEQVNLYGFLKDYMSSPSGILRGRADDFINSIRQKGNNSFADFVEDFINDELKYREGVSASAAARHGIFVGVPYDASVLEQIFDAYNKDDYNERLFNRAIKLAKRFGVSIKFVTRNEDGSFFSAFGNYNPHDNTITLDANLLVKGNESELCQTIVHELIHSVVARAASIMTGRAVDKNNQFIDPQSLPKDVVDGINTLKEVYESIKDDGTFQDTYGKRDFEEMLSEITDPKFRGLLKAKKLWKKFLSGICKILGIADESSSETDALTEIESALDNILSAAERGELDSAYASYLGQLAEGYTLADLQKLGSGPVKTLLTQNVLFRTWIDKEAARASARDAFDEAAFVSFQAIADSISNATGFKGKAKAVKTGFIKTWNEYQMEHQDDQQYVIAGMEAIMQETGNTPIEDYENYLFWQNQMQSRSAEQIETYLDRYYKPIIAQINAIVTQILKSRGIKETNRAERMKVYAEVMQYLIAKHGLERNKLYQTTKTRNLNIGERTRERNNAQKIYDDKVNQINMDASLTDAERQLQLREALDEYNATLEEIKTRQVPDIRDYSGLTALFGLDSKEYLEAGILARELVDNFENEVSTDELWAKINAATNKTLRHSYECGLLSRSQYEQIRDMFQYYIPLRGFDETTAEDVYSYSRFEGNSFSPAVMKAGGRTSVANDPIAYIMTMATSEIIQGNHNKEKQALYHFVANRPNSLLSIRDCWYVKDPATGNYIETYPDIEGGETWEDFEAKMEALAKSKSAIKRKKGLDVGYRFQKPANKNLHYIHVMINGVERAIVVNGNPRLAEGVNGIEDSKHKDLIKQVKRVNRVASQLFTNYNYKFGGKNFIRDFLFAQTMMLIDESPMYNLRFAANWFKYNPFTIGTLMRKYKKGTLDLSKEGHRLFKEFVENGGKTGYVFIDKLEKQKDRINAAVERMSEVGNTTTNGVAKARVLLDVISYVNECIELAARFGTYATSRQAKDKTGKERSIIRSIDDAKNITTNFNRKGAQSGRGFIGGLAAFMGSWNFFYNAGVQGVQRVWSSARKHPVKSAIFWGGWVALGYLMPYIIDIFRGDDDEEEDIYWNLPAYERKNNVCMPFGKGKVTATIPLSPQIRECYAIGVTLSDATFNKSVDKDATALAMEVASLLAKAFLPANPLEGLSSGLTPAENLIMFGTPDIADPIAEVVINKDWTGAPIEYRTTYNEGAPHYTKVIGKDDWKKSVGEKLYKLGEDNLDSSMDWNLSAWEHVIKGGSGGLGVLFKDISNVVHWVISWEAPERLNDIPVARTFLSSNAMDDEKFVNNIYWDMDEIYQRKMQTISKVYGLTPTEVFKDKKGKGNANLVKVYEAKAYPFLEEYYKLNQEISKKYRDIRKMPEDTEAQKNAKVIEEQKLFNMKRDLVYKLLEYEIE